MATQPRPSRLASWERKTSSSSPPVSRSEFTTETLGVAVGRGMPPPPAASRHCTSAWRIVFMALFGGLNAGFLVHPTGGFVGAACWEKRIGIFDDGIWREPGWIDRLGGIEF